MKKYKFKFVHLFVIIISFCSVSSQFVPYLLFPPTAPTRHQYIAGIGIPVPGAKPDCVFGLVLKGQYFLPTVIDDIKPAYISFKPEDQKRRLQRDLSMSNDSFSFIDDYGTKVERWNNVNVEDNGISPLDESESDNEKSNENQNWDPNMTGETFREMWKKQRNMDYSRWAIYKTIEAIIDRRGSNGMNCVLRAICESAQSSFSFHSGIIAELMHIILT